MRIVCDTNVIISALLWAGTPARIWDRVESGADRLLISRPMLDELTRVLGYPKIARALARRSLRPRDVVGAVVGTAELVWPRRLTSPVVREDPDDDHVLACAVAAGAEFVITGDAHLLALGRWQGIRIMTPGNYLEVAAGTSQGGL